MNIKSSQISSVAPSNFDWNLMRTFLATMDQQSFLGAARELQSSQPTVGRQIFELEQQLGATLFERTGRGLIPSALALRLEPIARQMEVAALLLTRSAAGAGREIAGRVRISASQPVACVLLPPILTKMRTALPEIAVDLVVSNEVSNLLKREADIALRMVQPEQSSLIAKRVGQISLGTYAHPNYLRRCGSPQQASDLLQHDVIADDRNQQIELGFRKMGYELDASRIVLRTDDFMAYAAAVRAGLGIGFMADYLAQTDSQLIPLLPTLQLPKIPLWLVVHREIRSNRRIKAVFDYLASALPKAL